MVHFSKLQLTGFKSFADTTAIDVMPGLTGIVGPNGCGKSNLVEALRWLMGESAPTQMRGSEMDDVIFAGTKFRPAKNRAEVTLTLGASEEKPFPSPYEKEELLEVTRRIERGMGSDYLINGKIVRAKDLKMLFADTATGANSPAIVSQGRVSEIIQAKPTDRRVVLEEAAGITGLHGRRKEAEQRLRAAEKNLTRVEDMLGEKQTLYRSLVRQAGQAKRYRTLSDQIRRLEGVLVYRRWLATEEKKQDSLKQMEQSNEQLNTLKRQRHDAQVGHDTLMSKHQSLQTTLTNLRDKRNRLKLNHERLADDQRRRQEDHSTAVQKVEELTTDTLNQKQFLSTAQERQETLKSELETLNQSLNGFEERRTSAEEERDRARNEYEEVKDQLNELQNRRAELAGQYRRLEESIEQDERDRNDLQQTLEKLLESLKEHQSELNNLETKTSQFEDITSITAKLSDSETEVETSRQDVASAREELNRAQEKHREAAGEVTTLQSELAAIQRLIKTQEERYSETEFSPIIQNLNVKSGYEIALTTAIAQGSQAAEDESAPFYWSKTGSKKGNSLPNGLTSLLDYVKGPENLTLFLSQTGVVKTTEEGDKLSGQLSPGQALVSLDGDLWRWDGLRATAQAQTILKNDESGQLLSYKNRAQELETALQKALKNSEKRQQAVSNAEERYQQAENRRSQAENSLAEQRQNLEQQRAENQSIAQQKQVTQTRIDALLEKQQDLQSRSEKLSHRIEQNRKALSELPDSSGTTDELESIAQSVRECETELNEKQNNYAEINAEYRQNRDRVDTLSSDIERQSNQIKEAAQRLEQLQARLKRAEESVDAISTSPDDFQEKSEALDKQIAEVDQEIAATQESYETALGEARQSEEQINLLQEQIANAREAYARYETHHQNAETQLLEVKEQVAQTFDCEPEQLKELLELEESDKEGSLDHLKEQFEKLRDQRERIGAVNLRAEEEAETIKQELDELTTEHEDITEAVTTLRQGISRLNRDARAKMLAAFETVNGHFKKMFTQLFRGGEAYLELIDADDPLDAGLEIYASPPGKKLQNLSLLSGGEQSLTAIALLFSMFLTNPSPICILDEIDAPLDDANVERLCTLLTEFAGVHTTRFLIITHNPITMSTMHRLYGVTMAEKGVSKLVSVDLETYSGETPEQLELAAAE